jgi:hypothetical protein
MLWQTRGDAWLPFAAHFGWAWIATTVLSGEPIDISIHRHGLPYGATASGWYAWLAAFGFALLAIKTWPKLDPQWTQWQEAKQ